MQHSDKPLKELQQAKEVLQNMSLAKNIIDLEALWKRFLHHLERTWNKAEAHYSRSPKWSGWHGRYAQARKKDELLVYLAKARDADEHGIEDISHAQPGFLAIGAANPDEKFELSVRINNEGDIFVRGASSPLRIEGMRAHVRLLPVTNRGRTYEVPKQHLGSPVNSSDLTELARIGITFYEDFLNAADTFFITDPKR